MRLEVRSYGSVALVTRKLRVKTATDALMHGFFEGVAGGTCTEHYSCISFISGISNCLLFFFFNPSMSVGVLTGNRWSAQIRVIQEGFIYNGTPAGTWAGGGGEHSDQRLVSHDGVYHPWLPGDGAVTCLERECLAEVTLRSETSPVEGTGPRSYPHLPLPLTS